VRLRLIWEYEADLLAANMLLQDIVAPETVKAFEGVYDTGPVSRVQAMLGAILVVFLLVAHVTPSRWSVLPRLPMTASRD